MSAGRFFAIVVAGSCLACPSSAPTLDGGCAGGQTCGFIDHKYFSTYSCPPSPPFFPGGSMGYSWRLLIDCQQGCSTAASWGCDTSGCDTGCITDHGSGQWLPCSEANHAVAGSGGCFLSGSGVNGETIPCECR